MRALASLTFTWACLHAGFAAASPATADAAGCSRGWDQLLSAQQRAQAEAARDCGKDAARTSISLADQVAVYDRPLTNGPLGPLATPGQKAAATGIAAARPKRPLPSPLAVRAEGTARPAVFAPLIDRAARAHDIDPLLLHAIARVESRHQPDAISHAGAHGMMQVIVPTARRFGVDGAKNLHDPQTNLDVSARYLKTLQRRFGNDLPLVLAAYNAGEGAVEKYGRQIPPYRETQGYVRKVISEYELLRRISVRRDAALSAHASAEPAL